MPTDKRPPASPPPVPAAEPLAPSPTIKIAEPAPPPPRPYKTAPVLIDEEPVGARATPQAITDGQVTIAVEGERIVARRIGEAIPANLPIVAPAPPTPRMLAKREAEEAAGRKAVAHAAEQQAHRPPLVKSPAEIAAEGTTTHVFRPGDIREYLDLRRGHTSKDAGSSLLQRVQRTLPEG